MALGGLRALLLQACHPLAMAGVAQHSGYQSDPWGRLFRTADYVATVTYGTLTEARDAAERVRRLHGRLTGVEPESGVAYQVSDPHLLRWVHCAEVDSFLTAYRRCGGRLTRAEADAYVAEQARGAALLGVEPAMCPMSAADLERYFSRMRGELKVTDAAAEALRFVLAPPMPLPARPAWAGLASVAFGLLPRWARRLYGLPWALTAHPGADIAASAAGRSARTLVRLVPERIRESPARRAALERVGHRG